MITIEDLNSALYSASSAFDVALHGDNDAFSLAVELQKGFDEILTEYKEANPAQLLFIDVINKKVSITQDE
ncbi:hypothetical protein ACLH2P_18290 [Klebsiella michiganensis]